MSHRECVRIDGVEVTCLWKGEGIQSAYVFPNTVPRSLLRESALPRTKEVPIHSFSFSILMNVVTVKKIIGKRKGKIPI